jgi:hypothetical protein
LVNNNILGSLSESKICAEAIRAFFTCNDWIICRYTTRDKWGSGNQDIELKMVVTLPCAYQ